MAYLFNQAWIQLDNYFKENKLTYTKQRAWLKNFSHIKEAFALVNKNNYGSRVILTK